MRQVAFQAHWTPLNCHLQPNYKGIFQSEMLTFWEKITLAFQRFIENSATRICPAPLQMFARTAIVPSTILLQDRQLVERLEQNWRNKWSITGPVEWAPVRNVYEPVELQLKAPDGTPLKGIFYRHRTTGINDIPTVLFFNGNGGMLYDTGCDWLLKKQQPFNVITFNYATDQLKCSRDLVMYGETVFQAAREALQISEDHLHVVGFSLGGSIGASVLALHPFAGRMVNVNSFDSLKAVISHRSSPLNRIVPHPYLKNVLAEVSALIGWRLEPGNALRGLKNKTLFVCNPHDDIIPFDRTAASALKKTHFLFRKSPGPVIASDRVILLKLKNGRARPDSSHNASLSHYEDGAGRSVSRRIVDFILGRGVAASR